MSDILLETSKYFN